MDALKHTGLSYFLPVNSLSPRDHHSEVTKPTVPSLSQAWVPYSKGPPLCPPARQARNSVRQHGTTPHPQHNLTSPPHWQLPHATVHAGVSRVLPRGATSSPSCLAPRPATLPTAHGQGYPPALHRRPPHPATLCRQEPHHTRSSQIPVPPPSLSLHRLSLHLSEPSSPLTGHSESRPAGWGFGCWEPGAHLPFTCASFAIGTEWRKVSAGSAEIRTRQPARAPGRLKTRSRFGKFSGDNSKSQQKGLMAEVTVRAKTRWWSLRWERCPQSASQRGSTPEVQPHCPPRDAGTSGGKTDTRQQRPKPRPARAARWHLCPCASVNSTPGSPVTRCGARANYLSRNWRHRLRLYRCSRWQPGEGRFRESSEGGPGTFGWTFGPGRGRRTPLSHPPAFPLLANLFVCYRPKSIIILVLLLFKVRNMNLHFFIHVSHYSALQDSFAPWKISSVPSIHPSLPSPETTATTISLSLVLPFPKCHKVGIIQYVPFSADFFT